MELDDEEEPEPELDFEPVVELPLEFALAASDLAAACALAIDLSVPGLGAVVPPFIRSAVTGPSDSSEAVAAYDESVAVVEPGEVELAVDVAAASAGGVVQELDASDEVSVFIEVLGVVCAWSD